MRLLLSVFTVFLLVSFSPAQAGSKEENIRKLLTITGSENLAQQFMDQMWPAIWLLVRKSQPDIPEELADILKEEFKGAMDEALPMLTESSIDIYAKYFTAAETEELLAWYETDLGKKTIEVMPQLLKDSTAMGQKWGLEVAAPRGMERVRARLRAEGYDL